MHQSALLSLLSVALTTVNASPALEARDPTRSCAGFNEGQTVRLGPSQYIVTCNTNYGPEDMYDARRIEGLDLQGCIQRCSQFPISQCKVPVSDGQTCWHKIPGSEPQGLHTVHTGRRITAEAAQKYTRRGVPVATDESGLCTESDRRPRIFVARKGLNSPRGNVVAEDSYFLAECNTDYNPVVGDASRFPIANFDLCLLECAGMGQSCKAGSFMAGQCSFKHTANRREERRPIDSGMRISARPMQMAIRLSELA